MFYIKHDNYHIADYIESVPAENLKIGEFIIILKGIDNIVSLNYKLIEIKYSKIYIFSNLNNEYGGYLCAYNNNGSLVYLCQNSEKYGNNNDLEENVRLSIYNNSKNKNIAEDIVIDSKIIGEKNGDKIISYIIIPLDSQNFMCLLSDFRYSNSACCNYIIFGEYSENLNNEYDFYIFSRKLKQYNCEIIPILKGLKNNLNYDTTNFEEILFALHYKLHNYLSDLDREINIEKVQNTFYKLGIDFDIKNEYKPIFTHKSGIKSYFFTGHTAVTINDYFISWNNYDCKDECMYIKNGDYVSIKIPPELKNKKNKTLFFIANSIANFECKNKTGLDPRTGDFYINGKISNIHDENENCNTFTRIVEKRNECDGILYKDAKGIILKDGYYERYYIKKYGYYVEYYGSNKCVKELQDRFKIISNLTEEI